MLLYRYFIHQVLDKRKLLQENTQWNMKIVHVQQNNVVQCILIWNAFDFRISHDKKIAQTVVCTSAR